MNRIFFRHIFKDGSQEEYYTYLEHFPAKMIADDVYRVYSMEDHSCFTSKYILDTLLEHNEHVDHNGTKTVIIDYESEYLIHKVK